MIGWYKMTSHACRMRKKRQSYSYIICKLWYLYEFFVCYLHLAVYHFSLSSLPSFFTILLYADHQYSLKNLVKNRLYLEYILWISSFWQVCGSRTNAFWSFCPEFPVKEGLYLNATFAPFNMALMERSRSRLKQSKNYILISWIYVMECFGKFGGIFERK